MPSAPLISRPVWWLLAISLVSPHGGGAAVRARDGSKLVRLVGVPVGPDQSGIGSLRAVDSLLFFATGGARNALWRSNGRPTGTRPLRDVAFKLDPNDQYEFVGVDGKLFFTRDASVDGPRELWVTNGRFGGAKQLAQRLADNLTAVSGTLFFTSPERGANVLWRSDGTPEGTAQVAVINAGGPGSTGPFGFTAVGGRLFFFLGDDANQMIALYVSDGTTTGMSKVAGVGGTWIVDAGGVALFSDRQHLWRSDGTSAGTSQLADVGSGHILQDPVQVVGNVVFFFVDYSSIDQALWRSDGTVAGTHVVADGEQGQRFGWPDVTAAELGGTLYFGAADPVRGHALWRRDGTDAGTLPVADPYPDSSSSLGLAWLTTLDTTLFFTVEDHTGKRQLWRSDGTESGTKAVSDKRVFSDPHLEPTFLTVVGKTLFFILSDTSLGFQGHELWALTRRGRDDDHRRHDSAPGRPQQEQAPARRHPPGRAPGRQ